MIGCPDPTTIKVELVDIAPTFVKSKLGKLISCDAPVSSMKLIVGVRYPVNPAVVTVA